MDHSTSHYNGYYGPPVANQEVTRPSSRTDYPAYQPASAGPWPAHYPGGVYGAHPSQPYLVTPPWGPGAPPRYAQPSPAQIEPDAHELGLAAMALTHVAGNSLQAALEAGEIIFRYLFRSDVRLLKARGKKCSSFRKLASHPELAMSSSSLWRAVAIYELALRFPELCDYVHVGVGHVSVVLGLPSADQFRLLRSTEAERWTRRKLQKVVAELRLAAHEDGALPPNRIVERMDGLALLACDVSSDRQLRAVNEGEARRVLQTLHQIRETLAGVEAKLSAALSS